MKKISFLIALLLALQSFALSQSTTAFTFCGESSKAVGLWQESGPSPLVEKLKCNERVELIADAGDYFKAKTKKGREGFILKVRLSSQKTKGKAGQIFLGVLQGMAAGATAYAENQAATERKKIMIFGGENHKTYLGCLSCSEYANDSVFNEFGRNGSSYSSTSIMNNYSQFGSAYSRYSACNQFANDPPVIVDEAGNYYGRLTINTIHPQFAQGKLYVEWLTQKCSG